MKIDHPDFDDISFETKEKPTNRDVLMYDSVIEGQSRATLYPRLWGGVKWLVDLEKWNCDIVKPDDDIEKIMEAEADIKKIVIIKWAALAVFTYRHSLEPEKNS